MHQKADFTNWLNIKYAKVINNNNTQMQKEEIEIEDKITYSLENMSFSQPLKIINHSNQTYAFKIKTNQKAVISMQNTHQFLKPHSEVIIVIKMVEKPSEITSLKLEINYAIPAPNDLENNDSKLTNTPKEEIKKKIIVITRKEIEHLSQAKQAQQNRSEEISSFPSACPVEEMTERTINIDLKNDISSEEVYAQAKQSPRKYQQTHSFDIVENIAEQEQDDREREIAEVKKKIQRETELIEQKKQDLQKLNDMKAGQNIISIGAVIVMGCAFFLGGAILQVLVQ